MHANDAVHVAGLDQIVETLSRIRGPRRHAIGNNMEAVVVLHDGRAFQGATPEHVLQNAPEWRCEVPLDYDVRKRDHNRLIADGRRYINTASTLAQHDMPGF